MIISIKLTLPSHGSRSLKTPKLESRVLRLRFDLDILSEHALDEVSCMKM